MARVRLGELLVRARFLQPNQLEAALSEQQRWGGRLGDILVRMNHGLEEVIVKALSKQLNFPTIDLKTIQTIPRDVLAKVPAVKAQALAAMPLQLRDEGRTLVVAMAEPENIASVDALRHMSSCKVAPYIASRSSIAKAQQRFYRGLDLSYEEAESSFHLMDSRGNMVPPTLEPVPEAAPESEPEPAAKTAVEQIVRSLQEIQHKDVGALKALVELMIEKGVFSREEYLAKVRRSQGL